MSVIMPLIHDQFQAAERIEYMHLGPEAISRKVLFPFPLESISSSFPGGRGIESTRFLVLVKEAVTQLERRLQVLSTPLHRLKCACFGRSLRDDPREDGVANAAQIVWKLFTESGTGSSAKMSDNLKKNDEITSEGHENNKSCFSLYDNSTFCQVESDKFIEEEGQEWQEFDCGLCLATHHLSAPEETAFLYTEIFQQKIYLKHGITLRENDLMIDVGANVGFFSILAELEFLPPNALRIIAIEPMSENFNLLKKNLAKYTPSAYVVQAAIGSLNSNTIMRNDDCRDLTASVAEGDDVNLFNKMRMTYFPKMPGNSCASTFVADKIKCQHRRADFLIGMKEEMCRLESLSAIIDESGFEICELKRISLLKVDVEGGELDVLQSIDDRHWRVIDQIVIETAEPSPSNMFSKANDFSINHSLSQDYKVTSLFESIFTLLKSKGFEVIVERDPSLGVNTGCVLIFATKYAVHDQKSKEI